MKQGPVPVVHRWFTGGSPVVHVQGDKVDSALILLPYYRHKLSYDPKSNAWIVEYQKTVAK